MSLESQTVKNLTMFTCLIIQPSQLFYQLIRIGNHLLVLLVVGITRRIGNCSRRKLESWIQLSIHYMNVNMIHLVEEFFCQEIKFCISRRTMDPHCVPSHGMARTLSKKFLIIMFFFKGQANNFLLSLNVCFPTNQVTHLMLFLYTSNKQYYRLAYPPYNLNYMEE